MINVHKLAELWSTELEDRNQTWGEWFKEVVYPWSECRSFMCPIGAFMAQYFAYDVSWTLWEVNPKIIIEEEHPENDNETFTHIDWQRAYVTVNIITSLVKRGYLK